jgi:hypothetical protein
MISRRNIRVKVMQTLYTVESQLAEPNAGETVNSQTGKKNPDPVKLLQNHFDQTRQLFVS